MAVLDPDGHEHVRHSGAGCSSRPLLFVVTLPALRRQATREGDPRLFRLLCWALVAKLLGRRRSVRPRAIVIYDGKGDAFTYSRDAVALCRSLGDGTRGSRRHDRDAGDLHQLGDGGDPHAPPAVDPGSLPRVLVARLLGPLLVLPVLPARGAGGTPQELCEAPVLPAVARLLAIEHRQGSVDDLRAGLGELRGRVAPDEGARDRRRAVARWVCWGRLPFDPTTRASPRSPSSAPSSSRSQRPHSGRSRRWPSWRRSPE